MDEPLASIAASAVSIEKVTWRRGVYDAGLKAFRLCGEPLSGLPSGFVHWKLLGLNAESREAVKRFCSEWGAPCHPSRVNGGAFIPSTWAAAQAAIAETDAVNDARERLGEPLLVSYGEAAAALSDLQLAARAMRSLVIDRARPRFARLLQTDHVKDVMGLIDGKGSESVCELPWKLDLLALGCSNQCRFQGSDKDNVEFVLGVVDALEKAGAFTTEGFARHGGGGVPEWHLASPGDVFTLTNAICNAEVREAMPESGQWRICERCGMPFKSPWRESRYKSSKGTMRNRKTCSDSCRGRQRL